MTGICTRCLTPAEGFRWTPGGPWRCVPCMRHEHGDELVDDAILNEHPELADDDFYDRLAETADRYAEVLA
jgi:hypothetical protein